MSSGIRCKCPKDKRDWAVIDRCCNYSAFNGYRCTSSDYSAVFCRTCRSVWRTKADYVFELPDISRAEFAAGGGRIR
jgi:hypothetical protein